MPLTYHLLILSIISGLWGVWGMVTGMGVNHDFILFTKDIERELYGCYLVKCQLLINLFFERVLNNGINQRLIFFGQIHNLGAVPFR